MQQHAGAGTAPVDGVGAGAALVALSFSILDVWTVEEPSCCLCLASVSGSKGGQCSLAKLLCNQNNLVGVSIQR